MSATKPSSIDILNAVKDITVAAFPDSNTFPRGASGKETAEFIQAVYDKLNELFIQDQSMND